MKHGTEAVIEGMKVPLEVFKVADKEVYLPQQTRETLV